MVEDRNIRIEGNILTIMEKPSKHLGKWVRDTLNDEMVAPAVKWMDIIEKSVHGMVRSSRGISKNLMASVNVRGNYDQN